MSSHVNNTTLSSTSYQPSHTPSPSSSSYQPLHFLDPAEFLWSFYGCLGGLAIVALRAVVWGRRYCEYHRVNAMAYLSQHRTPPSYAPLFLSFLLMVVLALRAVWSLVKYNVLMDQSYSVSPQVMALLDHLPLLFLLSAFSRISLFWVKSFGMEKTNRIAWIVYSANFLLYLASLCQITLSIWYKSFLNPHNIYYIAQLCAIAVWCLILSTLFSVYGWRLRQRLGQSIHSSQQIQDTFARILTATIVCTGLFLMRGVLFCVLTIRYNVFDILDPRLNRVVYPLLVYTVPDVVSSVCILFIMDVKRDTRAAAVAREARLSGGGGGRGRLHHSTAGILGSVGSSGGRGYNGYNGYNGGDRYGNFMGVGSIVDHSGSSGYRHDFYNGGLRPSNNYVGEGEAAYLDEQSPTESVLKHDWENSLGYSPPTTNTHWDDI
jgi:hypothetical protein